MHASGENWREKSMRESKETPLRRDGLIFASAVKFTVRFFLRRRGLQVEQQQIFALIFVRSI